MISEVRVKTTLNVNEILPCEHLFHVNLKCSTELAIKLASGDWVTIHVVNEEVTLRDDVALRFKNTGCHEEIDNQRECAYEGASHGQLENYTKAFHRNYVEGLNDKAKYIAKDIDIGKKLVQMLRKNNTNASEPKVRFRF